MHLPPAVQRRRFYAKLAWGDDYSSILRLEASTNSAALDELVPLSQYARRQLKKGGTAAKQLEERLLLRRNDIAGYVQRAGNVHAVPWSQAMRGISFLNDQIRTATWDQERSARRVVSRQYALWTLEEMAACRPPPPFDVHDGIFAIGFDQTYVRGPGVWRALSPRARVRRLPLARRARDIGFAVQGVELAVHRGTDRSGRSTQTGASAHVPTTGWCTSMARIGR